MVHSNYVPGDVAFLKRTVGVIYDTNYEHPLIFITCHKRLGSVIYDTIEDFSNYFQ